MLRVEVSENGRFLMTEDGAPFFYLGDTAWELFHRLTLEETEKYLENRRERGFNVIQAVILAELDGIRTPNANRDLPLINEDPTRPNERYFAHVDAVIRLAAEKKLYLGLLPTWGDKVRPEWGKGPKIFDARNARVYGAWLGERYRNVPNIIWILGGDRPACGHEEVWEAMAVGIEEGLGRKALMTYHPWGQHGSSEYFGDARWISFHMWQSGHIQEDEANWEMIRKDYERQPAKPVMDGEPCYEDHPINPYTRKWEVWYGRFTDYHVRKQAYRAVFAGACGHTYGHHSIWQMYGPRREPLTHAVYFWDEAMYRPGAAQMRYVKELVLSRAYFEREPAQTMVAWEGEGPGAHVCATRARDGSYAYVYIPQAHQAVEVRLEMMEQPVRAAWYDPRNGARWPIAGTWRGTVTFVSPVAGPDWVLELEKMRA